MYSLGIDIGGTKCAVTLGRDYVPENPQDLIIAKKKFPTDVKRGCKKIIDEFLKTADELLKENGVKNNELIGIGISCGGPLDSKKGVIMCPPNLPDWDNVPITDIFSKHFGVKTILQNDANACAVAEWKFGSGKGLDNVIFLTFGTGMGAGLILNGRLYSGTNDLAGEVGHIRLSEGGPMGYGKRGSFEGYCSGGGIVDLAKIIIEESKKNGIDTVLSKQGDEMSAKSISIAAKNGDAVAQEIYRVSAEHLGQALSILIDILNPEAIIIGSIYTRDQALFDDIIKDVISKEALPAAAETCKILPGALCEFVGDVAALSLLF